MNKEDMIHTHALLLSHKKEWNLAIGNNMEYTMLREYYETTTREYYAKWNKVDRERQVTYDFT